MWSIEYERVLIARPGKQQSLMRTHTHNHAHCATQSHKLWMLFLGGFLVFQLVLIVPKIIVDTEFHLCHVALERTRERSAS